MGCARNWVHLAIEIGKIAAHLPSREDVPIQLRALQARVVKASVEARHIAYELRPPVIGFGSGVCSAGPVLEVCASERRISR